MSQSRGSTAGDAARVEPVVDLSSRAPAGAHLPDALVDSLDRTMRRLRRAMMKPPATTVPVPALGKPLDMAKIFACDAIHDLADRKDSVTVKDVAAELELEHSTASRLLGDVEQEGLVTRGTDPDDRRRTTLQLTELGESVVDDATAITRFFTRLLLAEWPRQDVEDLTRLLGRLADTVHDKLDVLPEKAMAEFARQHPELAEAGAAIIEHVHGQQADGVA
jgi:DNA-binding MarR family transcriptional regulator